MTLDWELIAALSMHEIQLGVLRRLAHDGGRTMSPTELARELGAPLGNVSYHVRRLAELGLVRCTKTRQRRGATEHFYALSGAVR